MRDKTPLSTWLLTICGISSLLLIEDPATPFLLTSMAILAVWAVVSRRTRARLPRSFARAADLVVATSVVGLATTHFAFGKASLPTLGYVLIVGQLSRAFRVKGSRDLAVMHGTAVAQICLSAFMARGDAFLPLFVVAVILGVAASLALPGVSRQSRDDARVFLGRPRGRAGLRARAGALVQPLFLGAVLLACGAAFFVLLPRGAPFQDEDERVNAHQEILDPNDYSEDQEEAVRRIAGFTDEVKLGEVGRVKLVPWQAFLAELVIRNRPSRLPNWLLYWRGAALDTFTGTEWTRSPEMRSNEKWVSTRGGPGIMPIRTDVPEAETGFRTVTQFFYMKATTSRVLFALDAPINLELTSQLKKVRRIGPHCFAAPLPHAEGFSYRVTSCVPSDPERRILVEDLTREQAQPYLTLPPESDRVVTLARQVAGEGEALERAHLLMEWLGENCEYTLLFTEKPSGSAIEHFLFTTRAGHCEYFASALSIMLRAVGVPSRLVVGYRGGQWFEDNELYLVRQSDAHAWVEAHIEGRGWVRLDPTPADDQAVAVAPSRVPGIIPPEPARPVGEQVLLFVRDFGPEERRELLDGVGSAFDFITREGLGIGRKERSWPPPLLVFLGVAITGYLGLRALKRMPRMMRKGGKKKGGAGTGPEIRATFYEEAVRNLAARGVVRAAPQSPREFMLRATPVLADRAVFFREITGVFEGVRYGGAELSSDEEQRLEALARLLGPDPEADRN
jgi:transglutaminase-like putative cysteine protease